MRGALKDTVQWIDDRRIIPAYAGSTPRIAVGILRIEDHPRVCGEHGDNLIVNFDGKGSSPRMRGAPAPVTASGAARGIIPAYAGSTTGVTSTDSCVPDHPRVCGEHYPSCAELVESTGSSPRMRGAHSSRPACRWPAGIIPAYAGSTADGRAVFKSLKDHPRVCGEHAAAAVDEDMRLGSSPRMRGAHIVGNKPSHGIRIIPAYAGSTWRRV